MLLAAAGLVYFGHEFFAALAAESRPVDVAGRSLIHPKIAKKTGANVLSRDLSLQEILQHRRFAPPSEGAAADGCPLRPGVAEQDGHPIVLLAYTEWGRLAETPGRGVFVLTDAENAALSRPGRCIVLTSSRAGTRR